MITKDKLADVCRALDNRADMGEKFEALAVDAGVPVEDLMYVAKQRVLRMINVFKGNQKTPMGKPIAITLDDEDVAMMVLLVTAWTDGLLAGIKAQKKESSR